MEGTRENRLDASRVRTIPSWAFNTQYLIHWHLMMPMTVLSCPYLFLDPAPRSNDWTDFHDLWLKRRVPNTNTNTGSDVICCTDSLQITNKTILKINISKIIMSKVFKIPNVTKNEFVNFNIPSTHGRDCSCYSERYSVCWEGRCAGVNAGL